MKDYLGKFINSRLQIEALKNLAMMGNDTLLIGMRSRERLKLEESTNPYLIQIPIRFFPIVSDLIYLIVLAFLLPIHMPLLNRVSRVSYLFIAHPNKRCETQLITNLGTESAKTQI